MLDSKARKYIQPLIDRTADFLIGYDLTATQVTWIAFAVGVSAGLFSYWGLSLLAVIMLWTSGYLDAVDGSIARKNNNATAWGTVLDVTFDRVVEIAVILALGLRYPDAQFTLLILASAIILSMTIFLTVGSVSKNKGKKSFYYQAGVAERTEGFIFLTLMILFSDWIILFTAIFAAAVLFTALQRLLEAKKILG